MNGTPRSIVAIPVGWSRSQGENRPRPGRLRPSSRSPEGVDAELTGRECPCSIQEPGMCWHEDTRMSIITIQKQRSPGWWTVFLCACLAMGVYIAFEVLDLDGSNLRDLGPGKAIAAEPAGVDAERLLPQGPSIADTPGPPIPSIAWGFASGTRRLAGQTISIDLAARQSYFLPRTNLGQEASPATSPTDDPA